MSYSNLDGAGEFQTGSSGSDVLQIQDALEKRGYAVGTKDGIYGPLTKQAVQRFQSDAGVTIDGIVGPKTWGLLMTARTGTPPPAPITTPATSTPTAITTPAGSQAFLMGFSQNQVILAGITLFALMGLLRKR